LGDVAEDNRGEITDDDPCTHEGTYLLTSTVLKLTEDGADESVDIPIDGIASDEIPADQADVGDDAGSASGDDAGARGSSDAAASSSASNGGTSNTSSVSIGSDLRIDSLVGAGGSLFGSASVSAFRANGSTFRRTGLTTPSDTAGGLETNGAVASAMEWVTVKMPYCWAINHGPETDSACFNVHGRTCNRTGMADNPLWNAYRSDCAGLVSFAWGLRAPGLTAYAGQFTPGPATYIPTQDLAPGDALLRPNHHVVLFEKWTNKAEGLAAVIAEPGCSSKGGPFAQEQSWSLSGPPGKTPAASWLNEGTFYAIRKRGSSLTHH
jgi:hypothetical protein